MFVNTSCPPLPGQTFGVCFTKKTTTYKTQTFVYTYTFKDDVSHFNLIPVILRLTFLSQFFLCMVGQTLETHPALQEFSSIMS